MFQFSVSPSVFVVIACSRVVKSWDINGDFGGTLALWGMHVSRHGFTHWDFHFRHSLDPRSRCYQRLLAGNTDSQGY